MNGASNHAEFARSGIPPKLMERPGQHWSVLLVMLAAAGAAAILFSFNPTQHGFYPVCYFHAATGLNCPGCGSLRALHQLLHGHVVEAARLNLLLLLCLPYLGWRAIRLVRARLLGQPATFAIRPVWLWMFLCVAVVFT